MNHENRATEKPHHQGHRERLRHLFLQEDLDSFPEHMVLELLLFYAIPRRDINELAHALINHFGSLSGVFDAPYDSLVRIPGMGQQAATLLKLMPSLFRRYQMARISLDACLNTLEKAGDYLLPRFAGLKYETIYLLCLDAKCKVLCCRKLFEGSVNAAQIQVRRVVETALSLNASSVIIAHNHLSGVALPSPEDEVTTMTLYKALAAVDVCLADHIIVAENDYVSMAQSGYFMP